MIRPSFSSAWAASQRIYNTLNPSEKVATVIGGNVALNINSRDPALKWVNTCAVRMSYILNYSGSLIPRIAGETVSGADKRWYFYRVKSLIGYLEQQWGSAETYDHCYFNEPGVNYQTDRANFWSLS